MTTRPTTTIIAVTADDEGHRAVVEQAATTAAEAGATVILYDRATDLSLFESPLPTNWSGDGEEEQFGNRLDPGDLEAAGQAALAASVRRVRAAGVDAYGWVAPKSDMESLAAYAASQGASVILVSSTDGDVIDGLRSEMSDGIEIRTVPSEAAPTG